MANFNQVETNARSWATAHLVLAMLIALAVGVLVGGVIL